MATLKPEDFDPVVIRNLLYVLLGPGWHGKEQPAQETNPAAQPAT